MPSPTFTLRLPAAEQLALAEMAKIYGATSVRGFAREILSMMASGDMERVKAFNARLIAGVGEQLTLKINSALDPVPLVKSKPRKHRKSGRVGKGGRKRGRRT